MMRAGAALFAALALAAPVAQGDDPAARLEAADAALVSADDPRGRLAAVGDALAAREAALTRLRAELRAAATLRDPLRARLTARGGEAAAALVAMRRLREAPPLAYAAHPGGALGAMRAAMALSDAAPVLAARAKAARVDLERLAAVEAEWAALTARLRDDLAALRGARAAAAAAFEAEGAAAPELSARAEDLAAALAARPEVAGHLPPAAAFSAAGPLPPPVSGRVTRAFGEPGPDGPARGATIEAHAYASARAPWLSTVRFSGEVERLGGVAILEPEPDVLVVVAGLGRLHRGPGAIVAAGEPIGSVAADPPNASDFLVDAGRPGGATLARTVYIEVRLGGEPVDPASVFAFDGRDGMQGTDD